MDSIFAIGLGLSLRFVVDTVGRNNLKLTGTIIGLWEGIILLHFLQKMPYSFDPYVGYAVRLFIDFLVTESITRLLLVVVWTGLGIVLADIAPGIWQETGMRKAWHRLRRELFLLTRSVPTLTPFTKPRIVRFSPSRAASVISSAVGSRTPSVLTVTPTISQSSLDVPPVPRPPKRPVPGFFPGEVSEAETQSSLSASSPASPPVSLSVPIQGADTESLLSGQGTSREFTFPSMPPRDNDDLYASSSSSSSSDTKEHMDPTTVDLPEIVVAEEEPNTLKQDPTVFPPTPEHSPYEHPQEERVVTPPASEVPIIPDLPETALDTDWENVEMEDGAPTPPPKDDPMRPLKMFSSSSRAPSQVRSETIAPTSSQPLGKHKAWSEVDASFSTSPFDFKTDNGSPPAMPIPVHYSQAEIPTHATSAAVESPIIVSPATDSSVDDSPDNPESSTAAGALQHSHSMIASTSEFTDMTSSLARASSINKDILNITAEDQTNPPPPYPDVLSTNDEVDSPEAESGAKSPSPSSDTSVTSTTSLLQDARDSQAKMAGYSSQERELERQIDALEADGAAGVGLKSLKIKELEALRRKMAKTRERAEKKFYYDNNLDEQSNEIDLSGLTAQKAVDFTEKRLAYLLSTGKVDKPLVVTVAKATKRRDVKAKLNTAMKSHGMTTVDDTTNSRVLRIMLPQTI
ncbi:uncharacterized protein BT62DRAFT_930041 [Guyanagaster necrorhizus]|uniref:Uncharacterized protein n=1 Tax=Guyanagaster necrorhizus TaxID=856835 RepID=A0A9P7VWE3_9AGAR|nr:uncharacterized protein BT62DRAFT_930041 [Guyanagaster necrorhizus MCA 3950]KAG7447940.1 hypothetical protein BT62DRAFT_930041 [Guyanagaster necrorhizus MCA 3950]